MGQTNGVRRRAIFAGLCVITALWHGPARGADPAVKIDVTAKTLVHAGGSVPVALPAIAKSATTDVPIGRGVTVTHARAEAPDGATWEAIVAHDKVVFSGRTGYVRGQPGGQTGEVLQVLPRDATTRYVLKGEIQEDRVICGQKMTALAPLVLDPATMQFRGASVQRLGVEERKGAQRVVAAARRGPAQAAIGKLLLPAGASVGSGQTLVDGDPATTWSEARPGVGQGEFVTFNLPNEVGVKAFAITIAPPAAKPEGAAPRTFFLATEGKTFAVTMPEDAWQHPGEAYDVPLPEPVHTTCVSIVLDDAYDGGRPTPEVTIAELVAYSAFDGPAATAEAAAKGLSGGGARADEAAAVLKRAPAGLAAVQAVYGELDAAGRAQAMDVAASAPSCAASTPVLVLGLCETDREVLRKAREKIQRCAKGAAPALAAAVRERSGCARARADAAQLLADVAPHDALAPLADAAPDPDDAVRAAARHALARAAKHATREEVAALLADKSRPAEARLSILRALSARLADARHEAEQAIAELLGEGAPMRARYLAAAPVAELARAGDQAASARLADLVVKDPEWAVRARAAEVAGGVRGLEASLAHAAGDAEPRVREAALRAAAGAKEAALAKEAAKRLADDPWTFVRTAAAGALGAMPRAPAADQALSKAVADPAPRVRAAAISAIAEHGATSESEALRARLEDEEEDPEVRVAAARALGRVCARAALGALTTTAGRGASPVATQDERAVGLAAIEALGRIHPPDLASRLAKAQAKDANFMAKRASERALAEKDVCK
jgi:HEAT repeats